jgi:PAS domain S-box-containing protein
MKKLSVKSQFRLGTGLILLVVCIGTSLVVYSIGKQHVEADIYKETEIYIAAVEATRTYVKDVLRPQMFALVPDDHFIPEAMSTSFVGREIMGRVHDRFKNFRYKRAALNPINALNRADAVEEGLIARFNREPKMREWSGLIERGGHSYYARFRAIYAEPECMRCHSESAAVPPAILARYPGMNSDYSGHMGKAIAADVVYIPVDVTFAKIKRQAWMTFILGGGLLFSLIVLFYALFNYTVVTELKGLLHNFKKLSGANRDAADPAESDALSGADEIDQLKGAFEDVAAELQQTHEELKASESRYRRLFESSRDPNFIWDLNKRLVDINEAGIQMFGFKDKDEALAIETGHQLFWDWQAGAALFDMIEARGFVKEYEISVVNRWGSRLDALVTANLKMDENGTPEGFEGIIRDVTERRKLEKHLAQTEKLASIGQLAAGVAHEINNPLGVIKCYANLISKNTADTAQVREDVDVIKKHTTACSQIVEGLLNFARVQETHKTMADIHAGIETVVAILEPQFQKGEIAIRRRFDIHLPPVLIDEEKMKQVYMNILLNAKQAMPAGGVITITTGAVSGDHGLVIDFTDTGEGIAPEKRDQIFDPFFTTRKAGQGTGLGLSISYGIIRDHGGEIQVESTPGKGSCFRLILPRGKGAAD